MWTPTTNPNFTKNNPICVGLTHKLEITNFHGVQALLSKCVTDCNCSLQANNAAGKSTKQFGYEVQEHTLSTDDL